MPYSLDDIERAVGVLRDGGVILYPTDTIWGIGCDAANEDAVRRVFEIKQRDDSKALILLTDRTERLREYVDMPEEVFDSVTAFLQENGDKPTTIIYPRVKNIPFFLRAIDGSVGIRVTQEVFSGELCARLGRPLVSTSANVSGQKSPQCFAEIDKQIVSRADYVCRYRQGDTTRAEASRILRLDLRDDGEYVFTIIRD